MSAYDHNFSVLNIDGYRITGFSDATDSIAFNYPDALGTLTRGGNRGEGVFVRSAASGVQLTLKLLQGHADNKFLNDRLRSQEDLRRHTPITCYYENVVNGDKITATGGWITVKPNYVRGTGHNEATWQIEFFKEDTTLTGN